MKNLFRTLIIWAYETFVMKSDMLEVKTRQDEFVKKREKKKKLYKLISKKGLRDLRANNKPFAAYFIITDGEKTAMKQFPLCPTDLQPKRIINIGEYCMRQVLSEFVPEKDVNEDYHMWFKDTPYFGKKSDSARVFNVERLSPEMESLTKRLKPQTYITRFIFKSLERQREEFKNED